MTAPSLCMDASWIYDDNLEPFVEILVCFCGYKLDGGDWDTIYFGSKKTDSEQDIRFEYEYTEGLQVKFRATQDIGSSVIFVIVQADEEVEAKVAVPIEILPSYSLTR